MSRAKEFFVTLPRMDIKENYSLKPFNTFGIDALAKQFGEFSSLEELDALINIRKDNPLLVLGGGSNILFTKDFDGLVMKNNLKGIDRVKEDSDHVFIKAGAGENWHGFVMHCIENNYTGVENLSLIPGSVGASPMQNIGAYGVEIKDVFHQLEAFHIKDKVVRTFSNEECRFGYRESVFKNIFRNQFIITSVTYRLNKKPVYHTSYGAIQQELENMGVKELSIRAISQAVINIRSSKLPDWTKLGNAGSFFKNPLVTIDKYNELKAAYQTIAGFPQGEGMKLAAGWLIEQCGWKGFRRGDAGCYPRQALVLVNYGNAKGSEIRELSEEIIHSVKQKFGVELEREVNII
jgi:UDP-N-acetylmuramate dehydrogenase